MPAFDPPPYTQQRNFSLDELSRRADPEWPRRRNFTPAYKFSNGRKFEDHRDNCYQVEDMAPDQDGRPPDFAYLTLQGRTLYLGDRPLMLEDDE